MPKREIPLTSNTSPIESRPAFTDWTRSTNTITQQFLSIGGQTEMVSLAGGLPAAELYPVAAIREASDRALGRWGSLALEYGPVEGLPALRAVIAGRAADETGSRISPNNVLITTGAMQGLDLVGKVLIDTNDLVVVQFPTYLGALDAWRPRQPRYEKLDWTVPRRGVETTLSQAKFVYTVPNYSNPTGVLVPHTQRTQLLERVLQANTWLVEDDPYYPLQLDGPTGPSIFAFDAARNLHSPYKGPVIYLGTLSKSIVPGLRVGWVIAEENMIRMLALTKMSTDLSGCMFTQAVALELLETGFDRWHSEKIVAHYRQRRDVLCAEASKHLAEWFDWDTPPGGMFVWMRAKDRRVDTNELYRFALEEKVAFVPSSVFDYTGELRCAMRVNFTRSSPDLLADGVRRLARAMRRYLAKGFDTSAEAIRHAN